MKNIDNESKTIIEETGFTQVGNNVINNIKSGDAFLVWCYLYSKSKDWKVIKQNIKNVYGFGDEKLKKILSYLKRANLIEYVQDKGEKGRFASVQIHVLNGSKFDITQDWICHAPHERFSERAVNCANGNDELLNKDNTKERKESTTGTSKAEPTHSISVTEAEAQNKSLGESKSHKSEAKSQPWGKQMEIMQANNPYELEKQLLDDFLTVRRTKRCPITKTVWDGILRELERCEMNGLKAHDCFVTMLVAGWQSLKMEWIVNQDNSAGKEKVSKTDVFYI